MGYNLLALMPDHCQAVIAINGLHTKYLYTRITIAIYRQYIASNYASYYARVGCYVGVLVSTLGG